MDEVIACEWRRNPSMGRFHAALVRLKDDAIRLHPIHGWIEDAFERFISSPFRLYGHPWMSCSRTPLA